MFCYTKVGDYMKNIKCVVFDIDGTLIARGKNEIEASAKIAIKQLKQQGLKVIVATGRASYFIQPDVKLTINPDFYVTINGQLVTDKYFNLIDGKKLDIDESNALLNTCREHGIAIAGKNKQSVDVYHLYDQFWPIYVHGDESLKHIVKNKQDLVQFDQETATYGLFMIGDETVIRQFDQYLDKLQLSYAYQNAYEAFDKTVGKSDGIEKALTHYGLNWNETIVFGDANNDIHMFEKAAISVAMGNASEDAKAFASYVTTNVEDDGIFNALKHFNLI